MKRINQITKTISQISMMYKTILIAVLIVFTISCEKWIDPEYNIDPGASDDVPMSMLIPTIQLDMGFNLGGRFVFDITGVWMQFINGVNDAGFNLITDYYVEPAVFNNLWKFIYTKQLINARILIEKAEQLQSPYNAAVGQILTACILEFTTDLWGDIPYSNALKGSEYVHKVSFDTQEQIYASIDSLLDQAILNLSTDPAENLIDIEGDVYYKGDPEAWLKAARAIRARHTLQLSKRNGNAAYTAALTLTDAFSNNADNMECPFSPTNQNPNYQNSLYKPPFVVMCSTFLNELEKRNDPRIPFYFALDTSGGISGSPPGEDFSEASPPGDYIAGESAPIYLMTFSELKFIEAEAALMSGNPERAAEAYKKAVAASVLQVTGEGQNTWLDNHINIENAGTITLEKIIMQKRHALVGQLQPYSDWRRTGIPDLIPIPDAFLSEIPQRYPYSETERILNEKNVPYIGSITEPVWWAQ